MGLLQALYDPPVGLVPFTDAHIEPLRSACAEDPDIWEIYPISLFGEHFDGSLALLASRPNWLRFAVLDGETVIGMTNFINPDAQTGTVEIGGTYIAPSARGTGFNRKMKTLLIDHAFAQGLHTVAFRVDTRNGRSMHAVEKLGARRVATLEENLTTWTGYVRNTAVFHLTRDDWRRHAADVGQRDLQARPPKS